jgi:hypothetical protein
VAWRFKLSSQREEQQQALIPLVEARLGAEYPLHGALTQFNSRFDGKIMKQKNS